MKQYEKMKESGVEWIGEIPEHWDSVALRYVFSTNKGKIPDKTFKHRKEGMVPYQSMDSLRTGNIEKYCHSSEGIFINDGDILILWDGSNAGELIIAKEGILSSTMSLLDLQSDEMFKDFGYYLLKTWEKEIRNNTVGMGIPHVNGSYLRSIKLLLPPKSEQSQIVAFLDKKTAKIDSLIANKERKIALLKEKRKALINRAVTKGLDPNAPMKGSGIEWIGEIPEHWELPNIRYLIAKAGSGLTPRGGSENYIDDGVPFIRSQNVHFGGLRLDDVAHIPEEVHESMSNSVVYNGDVLLNITGASIGRCCYVETSTEMNVNQHVCIIRTKKSQLRPQFLNYFLQSEYGQLQVELNMSGANREGLTLDGLKNFLITIPRITEQDTIVNYLDDVTLEINQLIKKESHKIELLKEYRQSLISEVVTGTIDIRDEVDAVSADGQQGVVV